MKHNKNTDGRPFAPQRWTSIFISKTLAAVCIMFAVAHARAQVTVSFEEFAAGTRISEQYAPQGVHFLNDFQPSGGLYRASPTIVVHPNAPSPGRVLVNDQADCELSSSGNAAMVFWFDSPVSSVSMYLGTIRDLPGPCSCPGTYSATVRFRDCEGNILSQVSDTVSTNFNTFVEYSEPQARIQRVDIDYGSTACPEAIDQLSFTPTSRNCNDRSAPIIIITSHSNDQVVNQPQQTIAGYVIEPGILSSLRLNGLSTPFYLDSSLRYNFSAPVTLQEGNNTITVIAENASGRSATRQLRLFLGTPASAVLSSFHLTQRGVMYDQACDVDDPLVVGKSAVLRVSMNVRTSSGVETYASTVKMNVWRKQPSAPDQLVGTFIGTTYSPSSSVFTSPSDLAGIHFWIPGYLGTFSVAGEYRFSFEAYVGSTQIGSALYPCGGQYVTFTETKPIRLLILPVERTSRNSLFNGTDHLKNFYVQLNSLAQKFPVRDGITYLPGQPAGVIYEEVAALRLCDGTSATADLDYCGGTGWLWQFLDKDPGGLLRRANDQTVTDPLNPAVCGDKKIVGGRIVDGTQLTFSFNPGLGVFRTAGVPSWPDGKHARLLDEDHDGDIDTADLGYFIAEFFDTTTGTWTTNLSLYNQGETFRFFRDMNGDFCADDGEPVAPVIQRGLNQRGLLWDPARKALNELNKELGGTASDFQFASLWWPDPFFGPTDFGAIGPGQGSQPGQLTWIRVGNHTAMAHELGHNFDLGHLSGHLADMEDAWAIYINGQSKMPDQVREIMDFLSTPDKRVFSKASYQTIFNQLSLTNASASAAGSADGPTAGDAGDQFIISGLLYDDGRVENIVSSVSTGLEPTPVVSSSPYALVFGQGTTPLATVGFAPDAEPTEPHDDEVVSFPLDYATFHVVALCPTGAEWVEIRNTNQPLIRLQRSGAAPVVTVQSPNGGESFGAEELVTIQWAASDADSADLRASVYYAQMVPGRPLQWLLLTGALRGNSFVWNTANAPGGSNGVIRVVVSDGFNSGEDQSDAFFSVATKPPLVVILDPQPGQTFLECARPIVRGLALDLDTGISLMQWSVDGLTVSVQPEAQLEPLEPGPHVLRLEAFDGDGKMSFDEVTIDVLADADCDGMSDEFENAYGLNTGSVEDAGQDHDGDGLPNFEEALYGTNPTDADSDDDGFPDGMEVGLRSNPLDLQNTPFTTGVFTNALYLNCGGAAVFDVLGRLWLPDEPILVTTNSNEAAFSGAVDTSLLGDQYVAQGMLLTERWKAGHLNYEIPVPGGFYAVILYFSENCLACVNPNLGGTGPANSARTFDIQVEGQRLDGYNQADAALPPPNDGIGATFTATEVVFRNMLISDGVLNVAILDRGSGNPPENPAIKGMAIFQQATANGLFPPRIASIQPPPGVGMLRIKVDPGPNLAAYYAGLALFELQGSTDLQTWTGAGLPLGAEAGLLVFKTPYDEPTRFYRVEQTNPAQP